MWKARVLPTLVVAALATVGLVATTGSAAASPSGATVTVHGSAQGLSVLHGPLHAGPVRFLIDTTNVTPNDLGSDIAMFTPAPGKTPDDVLADLGDEFSNDPKIAAKGTLELVQDARIVGLAGVVKGTPVTVTEQLSAGTYYLFDVNSVTLGGKPSLTTLQISGPGGSQTGPVFPFPNLGAFPIHLPLSLASLFLGHGLLPIRFPLPLQGLFPSQGGVFPSHATVKLTTADTFVSPDVLPAAGTITVRNTSDTIHFMDVSPVKDGTTDADIQAFFAPQPQGDPPFAQGPEIEMGVLSPGRQADITYNLPPGTYVLLCFVADDQTGRPHALMGMHKVVTLK